jgi:hypothetical protein
LRARPRSDYLPRASPRLLWSTQKGVETPVVKLGGSPRVGTAEGHDGRDGLARQPKPRQARAGLLPLVLPARICGGYGHGDSCSACERPVHQAQLEYRFLTQRDSDKPLRFHFACLGLWLAALRRRGIEVGRVSIST